MNRNAVIGLALVIASATLAVVIASSEGSALTGLLGKAAWYLPYATGLAGLARLVRHARSL